MAPPESAMIVSAVGAFFNILRFTVDLISVAAKAEDKKEKIMLDESSLRSSKSSNLSENKKQGKDSNSDAVPLVSSGAASGTVEDGSVTEEDKVVRSPAEKTLSFISVLFQTAILIFFVTTTVLMGRESSTASISNAVYSAIPLGASSIGTFFGLWVSIRDYKRTRFSSVQRLFYVFSTCITMLGSITLIASPPQNLDGPTGIDYIVMACLIGYFILAFIESKVFVDPYATHTDNPAKKAHLGKALIIILKPYFWPDETASSAFLNRTRAVLTWVCVAGSKACTLASPIFLGKQTNNDIFSHARFFLRLNLFQITTTF